MPDVIKTHLREWLAAWLAEQGVTIESVGSWAVHPGGPRILSRGRRGARAAAIGNGNVARDSGHLWQYVVANGPVHHRAAAGGRAPRPCVALGFGPGLTAEAALFV